MIVINKNENSEIYMIATLFVSEENNVITVNYNHKIYSFPKNEALIISEEISNKIPSGCYCYTYVSNKINVCPYWSLLEPQVGKCSLLNIDDNNETLTLFDQLKECGINYNFEEI